MSSSRDGCLLQSMVEAQCCFWKPCGAALTLSCLKFVIMSVMAGVDQHAVYSHLAAVSSTGFCSINVLGKREWPGFYSAGCGAITPGIQMFSYYPAAPAEIAVLPWAAAYPYRQVGIPPASYPPPHQAFVVWNLEGFIGNYTSGDHDQPGRAGGGHCSTLWASKAVSLGKHCSSCWMLQLRPSVTLPAGTLSLAFVLLVGGHSGSVVTCFLLLLPGTPAFTMLG